MRTLSLFLLIFFLPWAKVNACDCESVPLTLDAIKSAELIFAGEVSAVSACDKTAKATFNVKELYRGKTFAETTVEFDCSSDCQMDFAPGQTWIIYATYKKYGEPEVNFCSFSRQQIIGKDDYNIAAHGMKYDEEAAWLKKNLGLQELNVKAVEDEQHHQNIRPKGYEALWYLIAGFVVVFLFYFLGNKFLK